LSRLGILVSVTPRADVVAGGCVDRWSGLLLRPGVLIVARTVLPYARAYAQHELSLAGTVDCGRASGQRCDIGTLANGQGVTLELAVEHNGISQTNCAEVLHSDQPDPDSTPNNGATARMLARLFAAQE
jgi:hypothetical protein